MTNPLGVLLTLFAVLGLVLIVMTAHHGLKTDSKFDRWQFSPEGK